MDPKTLYLELLDLQLYLKQLTSELTDIRILTIKPRATESSKVYNLSNSISSRSSSGSPLISSRKQYHQQYNLFNSISTENTNAVRQQVLLLVPIGLPRTRDDSSRYDPRSKRSTVSSSVAFRGKNREPNNGSPRAGWNSVSGKKTADKWATIVLSSFGIVGNDTKWLPFFDISSTGPPAEGKSLEGEE